MFKRIAHVTYRAARRTVIAIVGATVLVIGVVMLFVPGPGLVVIPLGLAILSIEFAWARYWLKRVRERISRSNANALDQRVEAIRDRAER
ncbi:MAG: PGPGW domain-containing protein [Woeseiaceae bacterium]|nr:PGPGW domain-containing protein [Woeseiaceae bacterium]